MKKLTLLAVLVIAIAFNSFSQFKFGVKAGLNNTQLKLKDVITVQGVNDTIDWEMKAKTGKYGFHFGVFAQVKFAMIYVQPELLFTHGGSDISITNRTTMVESIKKQTFNRFDLPVMVGYKLGPARFGLGPVASYMITNKSVIADVVASGAASAEEEYNKVTWGIQINAGVNFWKLVVDAKYEFGIGKLGKGVNIDGRAYNFDTRPSMVTLGVGYNFL